MTESLSTTFGLAPVMSSTDPAAAKALVGRAYAIADEILRRADAGQDTAALVHVYFLLADEQSTPASSLDHLREQHAEMAAWLQRYVYA
jgi:hypothetical protein